MTNTIQLRITKTMALSAAQRYVLAAVGWRYAVFCLPLGAALVTLYAVGSVGALFGALATLFAIATLYAIWYALSARRTAVAGFGAADSVDSVLELDDARIKVSTAASSLSYAWSKEVRLLRYPDYWLLILGAAHSLILPAANRTPAFDNALVEAITAHGGKIWTQ